MSKKPSATFQYAVLGALFGLLFPIFVTLWRLLALDLPLTVDSALAVQRGTPLLWVIDIAPFFLGLVGGLAGSRQDHLVALNKDLEYQIQERDKAVQQLEIWREGLEQRVLDRTRELEQQAEQLTTAAEVGRAAASILDLGALTREVVELVRERFDLYFVGLFLLDDMGEYAFLEAGTGEAGQAMRDAEHRLQVGGLSMVGTACAQRQPRIALDVGDEPVRFDEPLLPDTRSEIALPMMVGDRVLGALDLQSAESDAFSASDITVLRLVADQVAVAIDNAQRFSEEAGVLEATSSHYRISRRLAAAGTTEEVIQAILNSVAETEADGCIVGLLGYAPDGNIASATFLGAWERRGRSSLPIGVSFSAEGSPFPLQMTTDYWSIDDATQDTQILPGPRQFLLQLGGQAFVNIPLRIGSRATGFLNVRRIAPGPFSPASLRLYQTLADQAVVALENARLLEETQRSAANDRLVGQITARMRETLDVETVLKTTVDELYQTLRLDEVVIRLVSGETNGRPTD
jgi:GAF domain-containing protein